MDLEFQKFNLKEGDNLVIKVDIDGLDEDQVSKKLKDLAEDEFVHYVKSKGHGVFVTYSGIDFQILRLQENDKLAVYVNLDLVAENQQTEYLKLIDEKLEELNGRYVVIPIHNNSVRVRVTNENNEENV